jgi:hypothetical protein
MLAQTGRRGRIGELSARLQRGQPDRDIPAGPDGRHGQVDRATKDGISTGNSETRMEGGDVRLPSGQPVSACGSATLQDHRVAGMMRRA